jgi:23S rRNA pseudouridine1911/1915/1917 synthase
MRLTAEGRERLDRFLARQLPQFTRSRLAVFIAEGGVRVEGKPAKAGQMLKAGHAVELELPEDRPAHDLAPADIELDVLYEDAELIVVNKPRGLAAHPAPSLKEPSLVNALLARGGALSAGSAAYRPGIVHRLDKETTGLMVVAKTDRAHHDLAKQFAGKRAERRYVAIVAGDFKEERVTVSAPLARDRSNRFLMAVDPQGKPAVTHVLRLARLDKGTLLGIRLETGRTHQIRAHLRAIGHPVLGDRLYAPKEHRGFALQLHAGLLSFDHPTSGESMAFYAAPPVDFLEGELVTRENLERV